MKSSRILLRIGMVGVAGAIATLGFVPALSAQATTVTTTESVPFDITVFIPCASENVALTGNLEIVNHTTTRPDGTLTVVTHLNPQGLSGVGEFTGAKYQGSGVTQEVFNVNVGQQFTFANIMRFVGQGPGNNFRTQQNVHVTVNANGKTTTVVDNIRADCS